MELNEAHIKVTASVNGQQQVENLSRSIRGVGQAADVSARQTANAMRQLPAQFQDIAVSLAGGQNPLMVLLQQGSQISSSFGSTREAIRAIGSVLTPARLAIGGTATALTVLAVAAYKADEEMEQMRRSIVMTGNAAGVTRDRIAAMAREARNASGVTVGQANDVAMQTVASGAFGPSTVKQATVAITLFQKVSEQATEDVVKGFASMREGVSKWANEYASKYALLKAADLDRIRNLEATQGKEAAMRETLSLITAELQRRNGVMQEEVGLIGQITQGWSQLFSMGWANLKDAFKPDSEGDKLNKMKAALADAEKGLLRLQTAAFTPDEVIRRRQQYVQTLRDQVTAQEKAIAASEKQAQADAAAAEAAKKYVTEMAKMPEYSRAERGYTESAEALLGFSKRAAFELQAAAYQRERNAGLFTEYQYNQKVYELKIKMLKADEESAMQRLMRAKYDLDTANGSGDMVARLNAMTKYNAALKEQKEARLALLAAEELGNGDTSGQRAVAKAAELRNQASLLRDQLATVRELGVAMGETATAALKREFGADGSMFGLGEKQKNDLLEAAAAVDKLNQQLKLATAGAEFAKQTKEIEANTRAIGLNETERQILIAGQDLENRGIKQGTEEYKQLMAAREAAIRNNAAQSATWQAGVQNAVNTYMESAGNMAKRTEEAVTQAFSHMEDALVNFAMTGKLNFREMVNAIIADLVRMQIRMAMTAAITGMGGAGGITGLFSSLFGSANGNAFSGGQPLRAFANGGAFTNTIATGPTVAPMALFGEAGPEAIMPLARDGSGRLGVRAAGGGGDNIAVTVNVNVEGGSTQTTASGTGNADTGRQLGQMISAMITQKLIEEKRNPGGLLYQGR